MNTELDSYSKDITKVFSICVEVLNVSRLLKTISLDLKLLAINGIVQAARIGNKQGQSLITLSSFLSDLPKQIAPELADLEVISSNLARRITIGSITMRRMISFNEALKKTLFRVYSNYNYDTSSLESEVLSSKFLKKMARNSNIGSIDEMLKNNIILLAKKNLDLISSVNEYLLDSQVLINTANKKIDRIRQNGMIANYMGSNISIESAYLIGDKKSFASLVSNIKSIVEQLNQRLDAIQLNLTEGNKLLSYLIKSGIIK